MAEVVDSAVMEAVVDDDVSLSGSVDDFTGKKVLAVIPLSLSVSKVSSRVADAVDGRSLWTLQNGPA